MSATRPEVQKGYGLWAYKRQTLISVAWRKHSFTLGLRAGIVEISSWGVAGMSHLSLSRPFFRLLLLFCVSSVLDLDTERRIYGKNE